MYCVFNLVLNHTLLTVLYAQGNGLGVHSSQKNRYPTVASCSQSRKINATLLAAKTIFLQTAGTTATINMGRKYRNLSFSLSSDTSYNETGNHSFSQF